MREIEFKGRRKDNRQWVYGNLIEHYDIIDRHIKSVYIESYSGEDRDEVITETVGQYTGLKDKNGVKIYEDDKVLLDLNNNRFEEAIVEFRRGCYVFATPKETYTVWDSDVFEKHIEVIGNTHDKELSRKEN